MSSSIQGQVSEVKSPHFASAHSSLTLGTWAPALGLSFPPAHRGRCLGGRGFRGSIAEVWPLSPLAWSRGNLVWELAGHGCGLRGVPKCLRGMWGAIRPGRPTPCAHTYIWPPSSRWRCSGPPSRPWPGGPRCAPRLHAPPPPTPQLPPRATRSGCGHPAPPGDRTHCCGPAGHPPSCRARGAGQPAAAPPRAAVPGGRTLDSAATCAGGAGRLPAHSDSIYGAQESRARSLIYSGARVARASPWRPA